MFTLALVPSSALPILGCGGSDQVEAGHSEPRSIRKQVGELTTSDLRRYPIWEFAIDEEAEPDQDEETVKPRPDLPMADPREGLLLARAAFRVSDGTQFDGYVHASQEDHIGYVQPTIVTDRGHVNFWYGLFKPKRRELKRAYSTLGHDRSSLFPLTYRVVVPVRGARLRGRINGFAYASDPNTDEVSWLR